MLLEHGDYIKFPDGRHRIFSDFRSINGLYALVNGGGHCWEGTLEEIYQLIPEGSKVIMKDFPYAMRKVKPYAVVKENVQLNLFY